MHFLLIGQRLMNPPERSVKKVRDEIGDVHEWERQVIYMNRR